ncbi:hypothetical protein M153_1960002598 [Pseudoloma neurophilia]|uniref:Uncharacterized protein n=1 Tax=Pseudoloma neurophilia TaxID=146866 RepID=A0A0R0LZK3_9MICR|nr:hypothetical protein M153_1960002598 [Pseudoloma neurophilia]
MLFYCTYLNISILFLKYLHAAEENEDDFVLLLKTAKQAATSRITLPAINIGQSLEGMFDDFTFESVQDEEDEDELQFAKMAASAPRLQKISIPSLISSYDFDDASFEQPTFDEDEEFFLAVQKDVRASQISDRKSVHQLKDKKSQNKGVVGLSAAANQQAKSQVLPSVCSEDSTTLDCVRVILECMFSCEFMSEFLKKKLTRVRVSSFESEMLKLFEKIKINGKLSNTDITKISDENLRKNFLSIPSPITPKRTDLDPVGHIQEIFEKTYKPVDSFKFSNIIVAPFCSLTFYFRIYGKHRMFSLNKLYINLMSRIKNIEYKEPFSKVLYTEDNIRTVNGRACFNGFKFCPNPENHENSKYCDNKNRKSGQDNTYDYCYGCNSTGLNLKNEKFLGGEEREAHSNCITILYDRNKEKKSNSSQLQVSKKRFSFLPQLLEDLVKNRLKHDAPMTCKEFLILLLESFRHEVKNSKDKSILIEERIAIVIEGLYFKSKYVTMAKQTPHHQSANQKYKDEPLELLFPQILTTKYGQRYGRRGVIFEDPTGKSGLEYLAFVKDGKIWRVVEPIVYSFVRFTESHFQQMIIENNLEILYTFYNIVED